MAAIPDSKYDLIISSTQTSSPKMYQIASSSATYMAIILLAIQARGLINRTLPDIPKLMSFCWQLVCSVAILALASGSATFLPGGGFNWIMYGATISIFILYCHKFNNNLSRRHILRSQISQISCFCFLILIFITSLSTSSIRKPFSGLPDGPYVWKDWRFPVQQQALAFNAPADNSLPSVVADFILHDTSFADVRPVMPGQEISNRPFLASLVILPLHEIGRILSNIQIGTQVPSFNYVGSTWPDTLSRISDVQFKLDFGGLYALNFLPIFPCLSLAELLLKPNLDLNDSSPKRINNQEKIKFYLIAALLICLSPIYVFGVIFTWPKMLAIFFAFTAINTIIYARNRRKLLGASGTALSLAYLAHPMTIVMSPILAIAFIFINIEHKYIPASRRFFSYMLHLLMKSTPIVLPTIIASLLWKAWYSLAGIPAPDLFAQNFSLGSLNNFDSLIARLSSVGDLFNVTPALNASALSIARTLGLLPNNINPQEQIIFTKFLTTSFSLPLLMIAPLSAFAYGVIPTSSELLRRAKITIISILSFLAIALAFVFARGGIILWHGYLCALLPFTAYLLTCQWIKARSHDNFSQFNAFSTMIIIMNVIFFKYWASIT